MSGSSQPNPATALITGASAGIGLDYADFLAGQGWNLVLTARRLDRLEQAAEQLTEKHGITCTAIAADLARREAPNELMAEIEQRDIAIDALINNAAVAAGRTSPMPAAPRHWKRSLSACPTGCGRIPIC